MNNPSTGDPTSQGKPWVFISYKVENANEARSIAELLLINDIPTWFAEYRIPGDDHFDDTQFINQTIDEGVQGSSHALLLTNDRWADSGYCRREANGLLDHLSVKNIAEIQIPPSPEPRIKVPKTIGIPERNLFVYNGSQTDFLCFLNSLGWFEQELTTPLNSSHEKVVHQRFRFGLKLALYGFSLRGWGGLSELSAQAAYPGDVRWSTGQIEGRSMSMLVATRPYETSVEIDSIAAFGREEDEMVHRKFRRMAHAFATGLVGTHLFFRNHRSNLAVTCVPADQSENITIERRYIITERHQQRCPYCNGSELIPYEKRFGSGERIVKLACDRCGEKREIPLEGLTTDELSKCPNCASSSRTNISVLEPMEEDDLWLYCLNKTCHKRFSPPPGDRRKYGEVQLSFALATGESDVARALRRFLRYTPIFDSIASSLSWEKPLFWKEYELSGSMFIKGVILYSLWLTAQSISSPEEEAISYKVIWCGIGITISALLIAVKTRPTVVSYSLKGQQLLCSIIPQRSALVVSGIAFGTVTEMLVCTLLGSPLAIVFIWFGWQGLASNKWIWMLCGICAYFSGIFVNQRRIDR